MGLEDRKRAKQSEEGDESKQGEWRSFYLLNPPAAQHQRTACLSVTLMSSNTPDTVFKTHGTELSHTPGASYFAYMLLFM